MARNKVRTLWTAAVTAFLTLCTALGLITTSSSAAVPQTERACKSTPTSNAPTMPSWALSYGRSRPPTMKQRIGAEAHGTSPSCRQRTPTWLLADIPKADSAPALPAGSRP